MKKILATLAILASIGILARLFKSNWKRTLQVVGGWGVYQFLGWFYDYLLWGFLVLTLGNLWGSVICSVGALLINFCVLVWYQKRKSDWLGVNILESVKARGHEWADKLCNHPKWYVKWSTYLFAKIFQILIWALNKNDFLAFVVLSIWQDSFITTAFLRHGRFGKLEVRDYIILVTSTLLSVVTWSLGVILMIQLTKWVGNTMFG